MATSNSRGGPRGVFQSRLLDCLSSTVELGWAAGFCRRELRSEWIRFR